MRVNHAGNLTVELIRAQRFDQAHRVHALEQQQLQNPNDPPQQTTSTLPRVDRVELSPEALASDPQVLPIDKADRPTAPEPPHQPQRLSPVVGSPALAGLGAAWIVPGTLLDVVA